VSSFKQFNIRAVGVHKGEKRKSEEVMAENFLNLIIITNAQIQECNKL
jgi:hypothetical protein